MSVNYASGLSDYEEKGVCGLPEIFDSESVLEEKALLLAKYLRESKHTVLYCGAGLSTSAGIPDFRGPNGVWTLEQQGRTIPTETLRSFDQCLPTYAHRAIRSLIDSHFVHFIVSQNIDGLFLKTGLSRCYLAELHGNYFLDECSTCKRRFIRTRPSPTMGCKRTGELCPRSGPRRPCKGHLRDTILDWEQSLPEEELTVSEKHSAQADLAICLGTTLQIEPAGSLPLKTLKRGSNGSRGRKRTRTESESPDPSSTQPGKLVIINLQATRFDKRANLLIHTHIDRIMASVCRHLGVIVPDYDSAQDPTKGPQDLTEWSRD